MGLNVTGSTVGIYRFENTFKGKDGKDTTSTSFKTYLSKKNDDCSYSKFGIEVRFAKDLKEKADKGFKIDCKYTVEVESGFITFDEWNNKDRKNQKLVLVISKGKVTEEKPLDKKDNSLPF